MRKPEFDIKYEKSANASIASESPDENRVVSFADSKMSRLSNDESFAKEHRSFASMLKQALLFLPGTFLLFFASFAAAVIAMEIIVYGRPLEALPDNYPFQFALIGSIILVGTFMTWFGLGDIKNRKHFAIPASLIISGALFGAVVKAAASFSSLADRVLEEFSYVIYLLPFALIVPILAKGLVDRKSEDVSEIWSGKHTTK